MPVDLRNTSIFLYDVYTFGSIGLLRGLGFPEPSIQGTHLELSGLLLYLSFFLSFNKYLLSPCPVPGTVLGAEEI
jgi:hypothetical protein